MQQWYQIIVPKDYPLDHFFSSPQFLGSAENSDNIVTAYFEKCEESEALLNELDLKIITEDDWQEKWRDYFQPVSMAGFRVVPPWLKDQGNIVINPGRGFGTGHHETTRLAAKIMAKLIKSENISSMIDVGTGSAVLSITARKMSQQIKITAIDVDEDAIENAIENLQHNEITDIDLSNTPIEKLSDQFELVVANIISSILLSISDLLKAKADKYLLLSGVLVSETESFLSKMNIQEFDLIESSSDGEWAVFLLKRRN